MSDSVSESNIDEDALDEFMDTRTSSGEETFDDGRKLRQVRRRRRGGSETGLAFVWLKFKVRSHVIRKEVEKLHLKMLNDARDGRFTVLGKKRDVKRLSRVDFVERVAFESDREPLLDQAD